MNIPQIPTNPVADDDLLDDRYKPRSQTPEPMHLFASAGLVAIGSIIFSFLNATPMGIAPVLAISGAVGFISHTVFLYHSGKTRAALQWILWGQSCLLIAAAINVAGGAK